LTVASWLTTPQRFWRAAWIRPFMLPLMSRQIARSTTGAATRTAGVPAAGAGEDGGACAIAAAANRERVGIRRFT
jgi:hypothetical protein